MTTVAQMVADFVIEHGTETVFTLPGSSVLTLIEALNQGGARVVASREESASVHAANGLSAAANSGFGCAIVARGPAAVNAMCGFVTVSDGNPVLLVIGDNF